MKSKHKYADVLKPAQAIVDALRPYCIKIELAGSLRRGRVECSDAEIVALPKPERPPLEFGKPPYLTYFDKAVAQLVMHEKLLRQNMGTKYMKFKMVPSYIQLDLFVVRPPAQWGPIFAIRTGPEDFSHWIVTPGAGGMPPGYIEHDGAVYPGIKVNGVVELYGDAIPMPEEIDFLKFCHVGNIAPRDRKPMWGISIGDEGA